MFDFQLNIMNSLHNDHLATLALLERMEKTLTGIKADTPPAADDAGFRSLLTDLKAVLASEVSSHFTFEEENLFPRFAELADPGIVMMLQSEHDIIRPLADRLRELAANATDSGFNAEDWIEFREKSLELVEREVFHIQKEEMGFLPALDQMLDPSEDGELGLIYAELKGG